MKNIWILFTFFEMRYTSTYSLRTALIPSVFLLTGFDLIFLYE